METFHLETPTASLDAEESNDLAGNPAVLLTSKARDQLVEVLLDRDAVREFMDWLARWEDAHR
jgi:hypothetical protein